MRKAEEIFEDARKEVYENGSQSLPVMAKVGIEKAQKEMFDFLYRKAENEKDNKRLIEFFDKLDGELLFNAT